MSQTFLFVTKFYWPLCHILSQNSQNVIKCHRISGKQVLSQKVTMSQGITSLTLHTRIEIRQFNEKRKRCIGIQRKKVFKNSLGVNKRKESSQFVVYDWPSMTYSMRTWGQRKVLGAESGNTPNPHVYTVKTVVDLISILGTAPTSWNPAWGCPLYNPGKVDVWKTQNNWLKKTNICNTIVIKHSFFLLF